MREEDTILSAVHKSHWQNIQGSDTTDSDLELTLTKHKHKCMVSVWGSNILNKMK